jgi:hypothetical protein
MDSQWLRVSGGSLLLSIVYWEAREAVDLCPLLLNRAYRGAGAPSRSLQGPTLAQTPERSPLALEASEPFSARRPSLVAGSYPRRLLMPTAAARVPLIVLLNAGQTEGFGKPGCRREFKRVPHLSHRRPY